jgi:hypothetical protein
MNIEDISTDDLLTEITKRIDHTPDANPRDSGTVQVFGLPRVSDDSWVSGWASTTLFKSTAPKEQA